jgi:hypothetical protein
MMEAAGNTRSLTAENAEGIFKGRMIELTFNAT